MHIDIVVNGRKVNIRANKRAPASKAMLDALVRTGDDHGAANRWELRDGSGKPVDRDASLEKAGVKDGDMMYLNLTAGVGGNISVVEPDLGRPDPHAVVAVVADQVEEVDRVHAGRRHQPRHAGVHLQQVA